MGANVADSTSNEKGGGGIGEKFVANTVTSTMAVPIATSPGRPGVGLQLSLSYDSDAGTGSFGFGWSLSPPQITRKTEKGLCARRQAHLLTDISPTCSYYRHNAISHACSGESSTFEGHSTSGVSIYCRIKMDTDVYLFCSLELCSPNTASIFRIRETPWLAVCPVTERRSQGSSMGTIHAKCCR